jgi:hypothetical protein
MAQRADMRVREREIREDVIGRLSENRGGAVQT